jgi:hypothetical protein
MADVGTGIGSMPVVVLTAPPSGSSSGATVNAVTLTTDRQTAATNLGWNGLLKQLRAWRERIQ